MHFAEFRDFPAVSAEVSASEAELTAAEFPHFSE